MRPRGAVVEIRLLGGHPAARVDAGLVAGLHEAALLGGGTPAGSADG